MNNKALRKDFYMEIKKSLNRFLSIFFIVGLGVAFFSGIRATEPNMRLSGDQFYDESNLMDVRILSTLGLTEDDLKAVSEVEGVKEAKGGYSADLLTIEDDSQYVVKVISDLETMNKVVVKEGRLPVKENECLVDTVYMELTGHKIGDKIKFKSGNDTELKDILNEEEYTITGSGVTSYYLSRTKGNSSIGNGLLSGFVILPEEAFSMEVYSEIYFTVTDALELMSYGDEYQEKVDAVTERIENELQDVRIEARYNEIMDEANEELDKAKKELSDAEETANKELADAKKKIDDAEKEIKDGKKEIKDNKKKIEDGYAEIEDSKKLIADGKQKLAEGKTELSDSKAKLADGKKEYEKGLATYEENFAKLAAGKEALAEAEAGLEYIEDPEQAAITAEMLKQQREELTASEQELAKGKAVLDATKKELDQADRSIQAGERELINSENEIKTNEKKIADAEAELKDGEAELKKAEEDLIEGEAELEDGKKEYNDAKKEAEIEIADAKEELADAEKEINKIKKPEWFVLDRTYLQSNAEFGNDSERIGAIGTVFPVIFFLVAALVSLTTMTRMVEEERTQIGTLKALGYSKIAIASKYIIYALLATIGGSIFGGIVGGKALPYIIINAYKAMYENLEVVVVELNMTYFLMATVLAVACVVAATLFACYKELAASPAELMRPAAPKQGKRVFMEKIPFIWNRLNFTGKSTVRNLIRYKKRFFMTIFGIGGCMALLLVGYGLMDSIFSIVDLQFSKIRTYDGLLTIERDIEEEDKTELVDYMEGQEAVETYTFLHESSIDAGTDGKEKEAHLTVPEHLDKISDYYVFKNRKTDEVYTLKEDGVIITEKLATQLQLEVGDSIYIKNDDLQKQELRIDAIAENYVMHYVFMSPGLYQELYHDLPDYNEIVYRTTDLSSDEETAFTEELLKLNGVSNNTFTSKTANDFSESMGNFDIVIFVLIVAAGSLAFVVLYNLNNINISERKRELATLKVLGFYDLEVSEYVFRENILLTVIGVFLGVGLGILLHGYVITTAEIDMVMFGRQIGLLSFVKSGLLTCLFSLIINFSMHFKLKRVDMASSLKSIE